MAKRYGRNGTHTAGVEAGIAFAYAFVVFGYGQYAVVVAVGEYEYRALDTREKLFDNHGFAGTAKHPVEHLFQFLLGLLQVVDDEHALTGCQTVGLEYVGGLERLEESVCGFDVFAREALIAGGRDVVAHHEALGKLLAALEAGTLFRRADDGDMFQFVVCDEIIVYTFYQRVFGAYHHHVDVVFHGKTAKGVEVGGRYFYVGADSGGPGITGSDEEAVGFGTLFQFPGQGAFAPPEPKSNMFMIVVI